MKTGKKVFAILAGVATAVVAGILFASHKGSTTRKSISNKSKEYADAVEGKFNDSLKKVKEKFKTVDDSAERMVKKGKQEIEDLVEKAAKVKN